MVCTCNMKSPGKNERWKKVNVLCIVDRNHEGSVLDHFRNFKGIQLIVEHNIENEDGIRIQGKGNYSKLKKGKLKTKKCLLLLYQMNKNPQYNQQTEPKQYKSEVEEICIYQNLESDRHSIYI